MNRRNRKILFFYIVFFAYSMRTYSQVKPKTGFLVHSWTFEDGTARDIVGNAHGTLVGSDAVITNGSFSTSDSGFMELPGSEITINSYSEISFESWFTSISGANVNYHMLFYFGNSVNGMGTDGIFFSPARGDNFSRTAISCGNEATPWINENGVNGTELDDGLQHHMLSIINDTAIILYIDGAFIGATTMDTSINSIAKLSNNYAWLSRGGYSGDPVWKGSIHEFNVYKKALNGDEVLYQFQHGPKIGAGPEIENLTHSWTFEDGTANDRIGLAHGVLTGADAMVVNGSFSATDIGYLDLPASLISINTYDTITFESWFTPIAGANNNFHMLFYFGNTVNNYGSDGIFLSPARGDNVTRLAISCGNVDAPWNSEEGVNGPELDDGLRHHVVGILTNSNISLYIDTAFIGTTTFTIAENKISNLSNNFAYLAKSGYTSDPTWKGTIEEFNIYNKALTKNEIVYQFVEGPVYGTILSDTLSDDATLSDLRVDNTTIQGFDPLILSYNIKYPEGTTDLPVISAITNHPNANINITQATTIPGQAFIMVIAENNFTQMTYTINLTLDASLPSVDATLSDLSIGPSTIAAFDPDTLVYNIMLLSGTSSIPVVSATTNHSEATLVLTQATTLPGQATVIVTAENTSVKKNYIVNFLVDSYIPSGDPSLGDLKSDGVTVAGFYTNLTVYDIRLPIGTTKVPVVTAMASHDSATVTITPAKTIPGTTTVLVVSEDGKRSRTYKINYSTNVGIEYLNTISVEIYPNPAEDKIYVSNIENGSVYIYSIEGILIQQNDNFVNGTEINISNLDKGLYCVQIFNKNKVFLTKFVKN